MALLDLDRYRDAGLLVLRVGIGAAFMAHGLPKLLGGPERWRRVGDAMGHLGIDAVPAFWGFMAGLAEAGGGLLLMLGLLFRVAAGLLFITMTVATVRHLSQGDAFARYSHALELGIVFLSLLFIGPGKYSLDGRRRGRSFDRR